MHRATPSPSSTSSPRAATRSAGPPSRRRGPLRPFTVDHFRAYGRQLILDNGQPWELEDFQLDVVDDVFAGAPEVWDIVPEENGKSTLMGGFALYHCDYMPDANVLLAASSRDQCGILLGQAAGFVYRSPGMRWTRNTPHGRFRVLEGTRRIVGMRLGGRIQVYAADDRTGDGVIYTLALVDELHRHRDMRLYRTWSGKTTKRAGQIVVISTAGEPGSEFEDTIATARANGRRTETRDGHERIIAEEMILHRWAVPDDGNVEDLKQVKAANPFSGITIDSLKRKRVRPAMTAAHWKRFTCNQATRTDAVAVSTKEWALAITNERPSDGEEIFGVGVKLSWTSGTTAIVPLWCPEPDRRILLPPTILEPPGDGTSLAPSRVHEALEEIADRHPFDVVALNRAAGGEQMGEWIERELGCTVIIYTGGLRERARCASRFLEALRAEPEPEIQHSGTLDLTKYVMNAQQRMLPTGEVIFEPGRAVKGQIRPIDALTAATIVHDAAIAGPDEPPPINLDDYRIRRL